jgi:hypothetical protein
MPFTPVHMGPGMLVKAAIPHKFSLMVFGWTQVAMDIQPLIAMVRHTGHVHGFSHTYIGALVVGGLAAVTGKYICPVALQLMSGEKEKRFLGWNMAVVSAAIGSCSHVALDSFMHSDIRPFAPLKFKQLTGGAVGFDPPSILPGYGSLRRRRVRSLAATSISTVQTKNPLNRTGTEDKNGTSRIRS